MAEDANATLPDLISSAVGRGATREEIARAANCSRVHLWRLETGRASEDSRVGLKVRAALGSSDLAARELAAAVDALAGADKVRIRKVLHLLHILKDLSRPGPQRGGEPPQRTPRFSEERSETPFRTR